MSINKRLVTAVSRRKGTSNGWGWQEQRAQGLRGKVVLESGETNRQSRFDAGDKVLGAGALG